MKPDYQDEWATVYIGDAVETLYKLPKESVHCCVTSPPYWGLRDYGVDGQIGLEQELAEYVRKLTLVFRLVREVLHPDGTLWLNMGDSYAGSGKGPGSINPASHVGEKHNHVTPVGLKRKDLCGVPWRVAFALQEDGWWLRSDIIWHKTQPLPETVADRPTRAHEYVFLFSKRSRYYYDKVGIMEPASENTNARISTGNKCKLVDTAGPVPSNWATDGKHDAVSHSAVRKKGPNAYRKPRPRNNEKFMKHLAPKVPFRNRRTVWSLAADYFPGAHFAAFPSALVKPCIIAGCPENGTILDPFSGTGTTLSTAKALNRKSIGIELNPDYLKFHKDRLAQDVFDFTAKADPTDPQTTFDINE